MEFHYFHFSTSDFFSQFFHYIKIHYTNVEDQKSAIFWYIICLNILYIKRDIGS